MFNLGDTGFPSNVDTGGVLIDVKSGPDALRFAAGPGDMTADCDAASTTSFARLRHHITVSVDCLTSNKVMQPSGPDAARDGSYAFMGSGPDGYFFVTAGNDGGMGIEDAVRLVNVKQMEAGDSV